MKKLLSVVLAVLMVVSLVPVSVFAAVNATAAITPTSGWYSDSATTLTIDSVEDLMAFATSGKEYSGKTVKLACDLDLNKGWVATLDTAAPTNVWTPLATFRGTFDGQGHSIRGIYMTGDTLGFVVNLCGTFKNLAIENSRIVATGNRNGTFACYMLGGSLIENCYADTIITGGTNNGGFAYRTFNTATIKKSWFNGLLMTTGNYNSGFVGNQESTKLVMEDCLNTGSVYSTGNASGFSNAIYGGTFTGTRLINNGRIASTTGSSLYFCGITYTISDNNNTNVFTNCYTVKDTAGAALPTDLRGTSTVTFNGKVLDSAACKADTTTGWVSSATATAEYAGIDFNGSTWVMDEGGPELRYWSSRQPAFYIANIETLNVFSAWDNAFAGYTVKLVADVAYNTGNAADYATTAPTRTWSGKATFAGDFDGMGNTISGLYGSNGLIKKMTGGSISNLSITNSYISGTSNLGAFVNIHGGTSKPISFNNCYSGAIVKGSSNSIGGFVGDTAPTVSRNVMLTFTKCWFDGAVSSGSRYVSGFVGNQESRSIAFVDCLNTGTVTAATNAVSGGISGSVYNGDYTTFTNCINLGQVSCLDNTGVIGAISGRYNSHIEAYYPRFTNCYALTGSAKLLGTENGGGNTDTAGHYMWVAADAVTNTESYPGIPFGNGTWVMGANGPELNMAVSPADVTTIYTYDQLLAWATNGSNDAGKTIKLAADIQAHSPWISKPSFAGTFDGQGFAIYGLEGNNGLIVSASATAVVKNLFIKDAVIGNTAKDSTGVFAGTASGGAQFKNLYTNAKVYGVNHVGGIVALATNTTEANPVVFEACWFDGAISVTQRYAAGIIGNNQFGFVTLTDCLNSGSVSSTSTNNNICIAGLAASIYDDSMEDGPGPGGIVVTNSMNLGTISAPNAAEAQTGGILGRMECQLHSETEFSTFEFNNVYSLTGAANYDAIGYMLADYMPGVKPVSRNALASVELGAGWMYYEHSTFGTIKVPSFFAAVGEYGVFYISTDEQIRSSDYPANAYLLLVNDIVFDNTTHGGAAWRTNVVFDGNGHTLYNFHGRIADLNSVGNVLKNVTFDGAVCTDVGPVRHIRANTLVENVVLKNCVAQDQKYLLEYVYDGAVVRNVTVDNCVGFKSPFSIVYSGGTVDGVKVLSNNTFSAQGLANTIQEGATIRNTRVSATIAAGGDAGFCTNVTNVGDNTVLFENCVFDGVIDCNNGSYRSGFVGNWNDNGAQSTRHATFRNCVAAGKLINANNHAAGFLNGAYKGCVVFENCLSLTAITNSAGNPVGRNYVFTIRPAGGGTISITNCYSLKGVNGGNDITGNYDGTQEQKDAVIAEMAKVVELNTTNDASLATSLSMSEWGADMNAIFPVPAGLGDAMDVSSYKAAGTAPVKEGKLFAGWFTDASCTTAYTANTGIAYPKFVDEEVASLGAQYREEVNGNYCVRIVSAVDSLDYAEAGFKITIGRQGTGKVTHKAVTKVLTSIYGADGYQNAATTFGTEEAKYFTAFNITGITEATADSEIIVTPYWETLDGTVVYGNATRVVSYNFLAN